MMSLRCIPAVLLLLSSLPLWCSGLDNGLALTPPMGWSTWNVFRCDYTETDLRAVADSLVKSGLAAAGYRSINIDDCWEAKQRTSAGQLTYDTSKFPNGIKAFGSYLHSLNLSLGIYSSSGPATCQGYPGSGDHELQDARTFASWGVDFLKLDACYQFNVSARAKSFTAMRRGLLATGRPIVFSCSTPELILKSHNPEFPSEWGPSTCNMARIQWDISDNWPSTLELLRAAQNIQHASRPGYWNDLDILTVGMGGQSVTEYITQFQAWSVISSPLVIGMDVRNMSSEYFDIFTNPEALAINQDRLGESANLVSRSLDGSIEIWAKALWYDHQDTEQHATINRRERARSRSLGAMSMSSRYDSSASLLNSLPTNDFQPWRYHAVFLLNRANVPQDVTLDFTSDIFNNFMCPHATPPKSANIRDAWNAKDLGTFNNTFTIKDLPAHGSALLTVKAL